MTVASEPALSSHLPADWQPVREGDATLVAQLADDLARRIDEQGLRPGTRLPSIRRMAEQSGVSRFTVVEAYDRLVARGLVQSRRGAGFFVRARNSGSLAPALPASPGLAVPARVDVTWLLRSMFRDTTPGSPGGAGLLPADWLDPEMVAGASARWDARPGPIWSPMGASRAFCRCASRLPPCCRAMACPRIPSITCSRPMA